MRIAIFHLNRTICDTKSILLATSSLMHNFHSWLWTFQKNLSCFAWADNVRWDKNQTIFAMECLSTNKTQYVWWLLFSSVPVFIYFKKKWNQEHTLSQRAYSISNWNSNRNCYVLAQENKHRINYCMEMHSIVMERKKRRLTSTFHMAKIILSCIVFHSKLNL